MSKMFKSFTQSLQRGVNETRTRRCATRPARKKHCTRRPNTAYIRSMVQMAATGLKAGQFSAARDEYLKAFRWMFLARVLDEKFASLLRASKISGGVFLGKGQEALSVAIGQ